MLEIVNQMESSLKDMLKHGRKFERMRTDVEGVFIRKIPRSKYGHSYLAVEINPTGENGLPLNKIGMLIKNQRELAAIREIVASDQIEELVRVIENIDE
jgi:hypothetical protein